MDNDTCDAELYHGYKMKNHHVSLFEMYHQLVVKNLNVNLETLVNTKELHTTRRDVTIGINFSFVTPPKLFSLPNFFVVY